MARRGETRQGSVLIFLAWYAMVLRGAATCDKVWRRKVQTIVIIFMARPGEAPHCDLWSGLARSGKARFCSHFHGLERSGEVR